MKLKKTELVKAMKTCIPGVEKGNAIIEGSDTFVFARGTLYSYNDIISVSVPFETEEPLHGVVKSVDFYNLISKLKEEEIELTEKDEKWIIKNGRSKAKITLVENKIAKYFKSLHIKDLVWKPLPKDLFEGIKLCSIAANYTPHSGIFAKGKMLLSTDMRRINYYDLKEEIDPFFIDELALGELLKFSDIKLYNIGEGWAHFKSNNEAVFSCRLKDMDVYPIDGIIAKREAMKQEEGDIANKLPKLLEEVIDRVSTFSRDLSGNAAIQLTLTKKEVILYSNRESGDVSESIALDNPFEEDIKLAIWIDVPFLKEAIAKVPDFYIKTIKEEDGTEIPVLIFISNGYMQIVATIIPDD